MNEKLIKTNIIRNFIQRLKTILDTQITFAHEFSNPLDLLYATCEIVAKHNKIKLIKPKLREEENTTFSDYIRTIAAISEVRVRKILLPDKWWRKDLGPLLGFYHNQPCALLPKKKGHYRLVNLSQSHNIRVTEELAKEIEEHAYFLYRPLPEKIGNFKNIVAFALQHSYRDLFLFFILQSIIVLFTLLIPIFTGYLFSFVVPNADFYILWQIVIALFVSTLLVTLYNVVQAASIIRLRFKIQAHLEPAIWDRMLRFPLVFFQKYSPGGLTYRANFLNEIQQILSQSYLVIITNAFMSVIFLFLMLIYNAFLALVAFLLALLIITITFFIIHKQLYYFRRLYFHFGKLMDFAFGLLSGILKIRVADASLRVFSIWVDRLIKRSKAEFLGKKSLQNLEVLSNVMLVVNPLILFGFVFLLGSQLSFGNFIAFNATFTLFFTAILQALQIMSLVISIIPLGERANRVLSANIDSEKKLIEPNQLDGRISIKHALFRYPDLDKTIFRDFSMEIYPGEFIALVGPSGTGKSTLFRLLLGFEKPQGGGIYYNGVNLNALKLSSVRKQIGVVMQNSALIPGTILDNIIGNNTSLSRRDAWDIAAKIGLAELIKLLPMQMDTLITEGLVTLSGGEKQRLVLARALVQNPKIIFLDEATSALDNRTQSIVYHYLKELKSTQVVAAHRLSTVVNADRIYVLENGHIVQMGNFETLISEPGLFAELAKRQLK